MFESSIRSAISFPATFKLGPALCCARQIGANAKMAVTAIGVNRSNLLANEVFMPCLRACFFYPAGELLSSRCIVGQVPEWARHAGSYAQILVRILHPNLLEVFHDIAFAQLAAQAPERILLPQIERAHHRLHHLRLPWQHRCDQLSAVARQTHHSDFRPTSRLP